MDKNIEQQIEEKTNYCLNCKMKPCSQKGCPLENDIPSVIQAVKEKNIKKAYQILSQTTVYQAYAEEFAHMKNNAKVHV